MNVIQNPVQLQHFCLQQRAQGKSIGFVPTMGFLHDGHLSLMKQCRPKCDILIVSIFVNPLQFGPNEDLDRYPKDLDGDLQKCNSQHVDIVFTPSEMYESNHNTYVNVEDLDQGLCGGSREGHFRGVTTVVSRLFGLVQPNIAIFGSKDYQQLAIIKRMVRDLAMPIEILSGPIVREPSGLALSSRNRYLEGEEQHQAQSLSKSLFWASAYCKNQQSPIQSDFIVREIKSILQVTEVDYISIVDVHTLKQINVITNQARCLVAAWVGQTRLIDNILLDIPFEENAQ
jgi:pantoate--beta-alanine ligase